MQSSSSGRFVSRLTRDTLALILAGGRGTRLQQLTLWRAKPAVPFGGKLRIIDFPLSNCLNSGIRRVGVLTQYKAHSLIRHIQRGWGYLRGELGEFIELLPAQQRVETSWYEGTADAVKQNLDIILRHNPGYVLILAGDHVYKMDYGTMLAAHAELGADVTIGCVYVPISEASAFGVVDMQADQRITGFVEKPAQPKPAPGDATRALVSMGIYVFDTDVLVQALLDDAADSNSQHDFGRDVIPRLIHSHRVCGFPFVDENNRQAYWRDVGTVDAYWRANMELIGVSPELNLYDQSWPVWTYQDQVPPAKFVFDDDDRRGMAVDSMVAGGSIISGALVRRSLLFANVHAHSQAYIEDSVVFPGVDIHQRCRVRRAIIERGCVIPKGTVIGEDPDADRARFAVSDQGIVIVTPEMLGQNLNRVL